MSSLKYFSQVWKIIMSLFLVTNLILSFDFTSNPCLMKYINAYAFMGCAFGEKFIFNLGILIIELASICSLFINKRKFKLICNIVLHIMCVADICFCIYYMIEQIEIIICIIEIIIDLIFMGLILFDIIKTYKKIKNDTEIRNTEDGSLC